MSTTDEDAPASQRAIEQPQATLFTRDSPRFELSLVEQKIAGAVPELFRGVDLTGDRFAFVSLRAVVDRDGRPIEHPLDAAFAALVASLTEDGDPGLAANVALDALCSVPGPKGVGFSHALECSIALFEPERMRVVPYAAGTREWLVWASSEEGRCIVPTVHHDALEKKHLRGSGDTFANGGPIHLAAADLVFLPSAGFLGRGGRGYARGLRPLLDVANAHLGEEPLRLVTLAKNAFWAEHARYPDEAILGDVRVAAVRAVPPPLATEVTRGLAPRAFQTRRFDVAMLVGAGDAITLVPLHDDRHVLVWLSPASGALPANALEIALRPILAMLDGDTGDNENPRNAGRDALYALAEAGIAEGAVRIAVVQLFDEFERVKYFRRGVKQPIALGPRGVDSRELSQFDEGGEVSIVAGARLFFPGALAFEGTKIATAEALAKAWRGGKASRLYDALAHHWKTKKTEAALTKLALAARSDEPDGDLLGCALVTGRD